MSADTSEGRPHAQVKIEPEEAGAFKARIQALTDRYEAQFLPRRKRKVTTQQIRDMDAGADNKNS